jgi:hypothetical protein
MITVSSVVVVIVNLSTLRRDMHSEVVVNTPHPAWKINPQPPDLRFRPKLTCFVGYAP